MNRQFRIVVDCQHLFDYRQANPFAQSKTKMNQLIQSTFINDSIATKLMSPNGLGPLLFSWLIIIDLLKWNSNPSDRQYKNKNALLDRKAFLIVCNLCFSFLRF